MMMQHALQNVFQLLNRRLQQNRVAVNDVLSDFREFVLVELVGFVQNAFRDFHFANLAQKSGHNQFADLLRFEV